MDLTETKLARVWQVFNDEKYLVAILTAFRDNVPYDENVKRNQALAAKLRNAWYGITYIDGFWNETQEDGEVIPVQETSILVIATNNQHQQETFAKKIKEFGDEYKQNAVIVKDSKGTRLIFNDGSEQGLGTLKPGKMGQAYSKLKKRNQTFIFEGEREFPNWIQKLAGISK